VFGAASRDAALTVPLWLQVIAKAMGVPMTDHSYDDVVLGVIADKLRLPASDCVVETAAVRSDGCVLSLPIIVCGSICVGVFLSPSVSEHVSVSVCVTCSVCMQLRRAVVLSRDSLLQSLHDFARADTDRNALLRLPEYLRGLDARITDPQELLVRPHLRLHPRCVAAHCTALHHTPLRYSALHYTTLYCATVQCATVHHTALCTALR
jgi:hypothetical protein